MTVDDQRDPEPHRPTTAVDVPAARRQRWSRLGLLAIFLFPPWAIAMSYGVLRLQAGAAYECDAYWAGDLFGVTFIDWPLLSLGSWATSAVVLLVFGRHSLRLGLVAGLLTSLFIAYWVVAGTADIVLAVEAGQRACPTGVPDWWPWWLPR